MATTKVVMLTSVSGPEASSLLAVDGIYDLEDSHAQEVLNTSPPRAKVVEINASDFFAFAAAKGWEVTLPVSDTVSREVATAKGAVVTND